MDFEDYGYGSEAMGQPETAMGQNTTSLDADGKKKKKKQGYMQDLNSNDRAKGLLAQVVSQNEQFGADENTDYGL